MTNYTSCFRPSSTTPALDHPHAPPPTITRANTNPNITTSLYQTHVGIFSLTWSHSFLSRSFHLHFHPHSNPSLSSPSFHLSLNPFLFWTKQGIKQLPFSPSNSIWVFWDLTHASFGSGPEPVSGFYIAVLSQGEMTLLLGDMDNQAYAKTRAKMATNNQKMGSLALRREHLMCKNKFYTTKTDLGGKLRTISIEFVENRREDPRLMIKFDQKRVLQVKHLRWKFRGSERVEVDGYPIRVSWDVHNWLFETEEKNQDIDGYALFMFRFEKQGNGEIGNGERAMWWSQESCGLNYERKKMKKRVMAKAKAKAKMTSPSLSSSSMSSVSSGCSSVMEWESVEENELKGPVGFSLLVYAWKS